MNRWKAMIALLLAMLYLPATGHCRLEQAGWLPPAGDCCEQTGSATGSETSSCADGCCPIEGGDHFSNANALTSAPLLALPVFAMVPGADVLPKQSLTVAPDSSPPDLPRTWQFACRTALPPRAPSFVY